MLELFFQLSSVYAQYPATSTSWRRLTLHPLLFGNSTAKFMVSSNVLKQVGAISSACICFYSIPRLRIVEYSQYFDAISFDGEKRTQRIIQSKVFLKPLSFTKHSTH
mmetsp:Transcript_110618/g.226295  ORF Transcript_110618/g.226295 Transcript_110618/m.226295 type:complete len:107 (+) Transcript_110618:260-580(+)